MSSTTTSSTTGGSREPEQMRVWTTSGEGIEHLRSDLVPVPVPVPGPGEVLVRIAAVSLNYRGLVRVAGGRGP